MLISMNWINDFVDLSGLDKEDLIKRFTLSTAEVEEISYKGNNLRDVVVGQILTIENHPDSKKLHLLTVDGGDKVYDVVCGAPNVRVGLKVPFVKEGGRVGEMEIKTATIAGYESHGMCCSERELEISAENAGLMELDDSLEVGKDICDVFDIKDIVFEVDNKSLTNRPDLWGHYGIAREFAALTGRELKPIQKLDLSQYSTLSPVDIKILESELCYRYTGLKVRNITQKVSPVNMRIRLFYCGTRAINLLADLTNYIMLELSQPMHAFDCKRVDEIRVKRLGECEFETLDGIKRNIDDSMLMICNEKGPVAIAGIMGGLESEIEDDTDSLLLESANFNAVSVRKSSGKLSLRTDASMRYEKTLDPELTDLAIERFMKLLTDIDSGVEVFSSLTDVYVKRYDEIKISFDKKYVDRYTGIEISNELIVNTLKALGFGVEEKNDLFNVVVPSWRATKDITIKADIIEEITRIYGYDNFLVSTTSSALFPVIRSDGSYGDRFAKDLLVQKYQMHEVHSYLWCDSRKYKEIGIDVEENVKILNAVNPDFVVLRNCMIPTLLTFANENKQYSQSFGIFEIGRVVEGLKDNGECNEVKKLGIVMLSKLEDEKTLFMSLRNIVVDIYQSIKHDDISFKNEETAHAWQHPINTVGIYAGDLRIGFMNTIHPTVKNKLDKKASIVAAQLDMDMLAKIKAQTIRYLEPSKYPGIDIDLSLNVKADLSFAELEQAWKNQTELLKGIKLIDVYDGEQKSITVRLSFSSSEKTLAKNEVQAHIDEIVLKLSKLGAMLKQASL